MAILAFKNANAERRNHSCNTMRDGRLDAAIMQEALLYRRLRAGGLKAETWGGHTE
jgi:hypothetical protein